ncbi:MAG TPA: A24 family peptidase [Chroococcales cyanobacterium]
MHNFTLSEIVLLVLAAVGVIIDWRTTKIPNWLTFPMAAIGIGMRYFEAGRGGPYEALNSVLGWLVGAGIVLIFAYLPIGPKEEKLGMGDAKLMAAVGAFLGWQQVLLCFFYFCLSFGLVSVFVLMRAMPWDRIMAATFATVSGVKSVPKIDSDKLRETRRKPIPAGFAIWLGALFTILFKEETLRFLGFQ